MRYCGAVLLGLAVAAGTWLYRSHSSAVSPHLDAAIHLIGPLGVVVTYLFMRTPTVGEKVDKQKEGEDGTKFALNLFFLAMMSLFLLIGLTTGR